MQCASVAWIKPLHVERFACGSGTEIQAGCASVFQIDRVDLALFVESVVIARRADRVIVDHLPKRDVVVLKEFHRVPRVVPPIVATAEIFGGQIGVGMPVPEIPFIAGTTGHQRAP